MGYANSTIPDTKMAPVADKPNGRYFLSTPERNRQAKGAPTQPKVCVRVRTHGVCLASCCSTGAVCNEFAQSHLGALIADQISAEESNSLSPVTAPPVWLLS